MTSQDDLVNDIIARLKAKLQVDAEPDQYDSENGCAVVPSLRQILKDAHRKQTDHLEGVILEQRALLAKLNNRLAFAVQENERLSDLNEHNLEYNDQLEKINADLQGQADSISATAQVYLNSCTAHAETINDLVQRLQSIDHIAQNCLARPSGRRKESLTLQVARAEMRKILQVTVGYTGK